MTHAPVPAASDGRPVLARGLAPDLGPSTADLRAIVGKSARRGGLARIVGFAGRHAQVTYDKMEWQ